MSLNFSNIKNKSNLLTFKIQLPTGENILLRPLEKNDVNLLTSFLQNLSEQTRKNYTLDSYDAITAKKMCATIGKYDKLRFVVENKSADKLIAIFECSFDIPDDDKERFKNYNIALDPKTDCRIGPCISDEYQGEGVGTILFPYLIDIAKKFNQKRLILWGGVFEKNKKAINFYIKNGFKKLGTFEDVRGEKSVDMIINIDKIKVT